MRGSKMFLSFPPQSRRCPHSASSLDAQLARKGARGAAKRTASAGRPDNGHVMTTTLQAEIASLLRRVGPPVETAGASVRRVTSSLKMACRPLHSTCNLQSRCPLSEIAEAPIGLLRASPAPAIEGATGDQTVGEGKEPLPVAARIAASPSQAGQHHSALLRVDVLGRVPPASLEKGLPALRVPVGT